ncbi:anucleate Primary sterigmata Protein apsA-like protein [Trichoderma parareesei]|uniref:Anucleate Primary sterigmata Protein apsA-like protein n=1 Tax=Trichoderma parareesei TaxID=858221 RepID=A0A2H2ZME7_TRIPA|nr:anucleate Primary sterigmata Protein apsA-like protein [Trichoderma parareesei]
MASSSVNSDRPDVSAPVGDAANDPFFSASSTTPSHLRFSDFDQELFAAGPGSDPRQAKRALEAHLAETDRRLDEAGKIGTALVSQRKALAEQLQEIEKLQAEEELAPELRKKLVSIEKEYNDLARESARVFLPKQRVASTTDNNQGSPFMLDSRSSRRSASPSKLENQSTGSPTKLSAPNRKLRNQPTNRVQDIEFAAEISTSLIAQVRNLQTLLGERDEQVKDLRNDVARLEGDSEALQQRLRVLDESEHRFKEENWNLQTRLQEMSGQLKEAFDREKKLDHALHASNAAKAATQKELDDVKLSLSKLTEEHASATRHYDIELGTAKRAIAMADGERSAMQRKIDELTSQNLELAKAIAAQRAKAQERESSSGTSDEDLEASAVDITPEHSPPQSPMKGTTPRHAMLETETLKTSLQHAQRTIQSQRSQLHREKTEKLEFRRIIQDLRDDLEKARNELEKGPALPPVRRGRRVEPKEVKVRPPRLLGSFRSSRQEVVIEEPVVTEDPEWEDTHDVSPRSSGLRVGTRSPERRLLQQQQGQQGQRLFRQQQGQQSTDDEEELVLESIETSDQFESAAEEVTGDSAFETAHEPSTETDDFQTGHEDLSDESDAPTEVALSVRGFGNMRRPPSLQPGGSRHAQRESFDSTASTSTEDDEFLEYNEFRTPTAAASLRRMRMNNRFSQSRRSSRQESEEPQFQSPGASFSSGGGDPATPGQSLFAELQDFGSDDESIAYTPSRRSLRSMTPASTRRAITPPPAVPRLPRVIMVDSGVMTDPVEFAAGIDPLDHRASRGSLLSVGEVARRPRSMESVIPNTDFRASTASWRSAEDGLAGSRPASTVAYSDAGAQYDIGEKLAQFPVPPSSRSPSEPDVLLPLPAAEPAPPAVLNLSAIQSEHIEPIEEEEEQHQEPAPAPVQPPTLSLTPIAIETVEPLAEPEIPAPDLKLSVIVAEQLEPEAEPDVPPPELTLSSIFAHALEPQAEPEVPPAELTLSTIISEGLEPVVEPEVPPPVLSLSTIVGEGLEPVAEPEIPPPVLSLSAIATEGSEPVAEPEVPAPVLSFSGIVAEGLEPEAEPEAPAPELTLASILSEEIEPVVEEPELPELTAVEAIASEAPAAAALPEFSISPIVAEQVEPIAEPASEPVQIIMAPPLAPLSFSSIQAQQLEPRELWLPKLTLSTIAVEKVEPVAEPEPEPASAALTFSSLSFQNTIPFDELPIDDEELLLPPQPEPQSEPQPKEPPVPVLGLSSIVAEDVEPVFPLAPQFAFSPISSVDTQPISPTKRGGFILPKDIKSPFIDDGDEISDKNLFASYVTRRRPESVPSSPIIAEDETSQSRPVSPNVDVPESQQPFKEISANAGPRPAQQLTQTSDHGAQTSLTSGAIDQLLKAGAETTPAKNHSVSAVSSPDTVGTVKINRAPQETYDSPVSAVSGKSRALEPAAVIESTPAHRPGSATSAKSSLVGAPPLPPNHQQMIQAARAGSSHGSQGATMGPPLWPASATKPAPRTPNSTRPMSPASGRGTPTPRAPPPRAGSSHGTAEYPPPPPPPAVRLSAAMSRQSSVSSFASELDNRFGMRASEMGIDPSGFGANTDPRMIQAITQTMIGEYNWKYTRKAGRGELSEKRHRRYFWVHPYTRTIYWSERDPSTAGRTEMKAKSLPIEGVRVVTDDNPMPPGLHRKSLVIISPGRTIKFTCTTGQRHETWFNALSYLLLRTSNGHDGHSDAEEMVADLAREDADEFNPQLGRRAANGTSKPSAPSLSSYNSRTTRDGSLAEAISFEIPTLTPSGKHASHASTPIKPSISGSISSRVGSYWKVGGSKLSGTMRSRTASAQNVSIYQASEVHDSAEDLREMIERQDMEADRLENVRACCDGKHDVGTLPHTTKRARSHNHSHNHHHVQSSGQSTMSTPLASTRSRA